MTTRVDGPCRGFVSNNLLAMYSPVTVGYRTHKLFLSE